MFMGRMEFDVDCKQNSVYARYVRFLIQNILIYIKNQISLGQTFNVFFAETNVAKRFSLFVGNNARSQFLDVYRTRTFFWILLAP